MLHQCLLAIVFVSSALALLEGVHPKAQENKPIVRARQHPQPDQPPPSLAKREVVIEVPWSIHGREGDERIRLAVNFGHELNQELLDDIGPGGDVGAWIAINHFEHLLDFIIDGLTPPGNLGEHPARGISARADYAGFRSLDFDGALGLQFEFEPRFFGPTHMNILLALLRLYYRRPNFMVRDHRVNNAFFNRQGGGGDAAKVKRQPTQNIACGQPKDLRKWVKNERSFDRREWKVVGCIDTSVKDESRPSGQNYNQGRHCRMTGECKFEG